MGSINGNSRLCRFYTKSEIGLLLVQLINLRTPVRIVDLGSGGGSLSAAVWKRWSKCEVITVDIDKKVKTAFPTANSKYPLRHQHHVGDVFDVETYNFLVGRGEFDAAICNPPYVNISHWREDFNILLNESGLSFEVARAPRVGSEILFLAQSLRVVREGGFVGLILPDSVISGARYAKLREHLLKKHSVKCVVELPRTSFTKTEAQAYIVVIQRGGDSNRSTNLYSYDSNHGLSRPLSVACSSAFHRLDYNYHKLRDLKPNMPTLSNIKCEIKRGNINYKSAKEENIDVFHTNSFKHYPNGLVNVNNSRHNRKLTCAEPGDILIARVHRSLSSKVAIVETGSIGITDCVFRVRVTEEWQQSVFRTLRSELGIAQLEAFSRGVAAKHISVRELFNLRLVQPE